MFIQKLKLVLLCAILLPAGLNAQAPTETVANDRVKSLTIRPKADWLMPPVVELNSDAQLEVKFDYFDLNIHYFYYKIIHCNADWSPSDLSEPEYLDGFNNQPIEERKVSFNTHANYTNYRFELPNNNIKLRLSGNYEVQIYDNNEPDKTVAKVRFSVTEKRVNLFPALKTITDIDYNKAHQQLDLQIDTRNYPIRNPGMEMKVVVSQNSRTDNQVVLSQPTFTRGNLLIFEHQKNLIFEAGNEFRRFEMVSYRYNGLHVGKITFMEPVYHAFLYKDEIKTYRSYSFDRDQNGRFFVRNSEGRDNDNEADYFDVHFTLDAPTPVGNGRVYLIGEFNGYRPQPDFELNYDPMQRCYTKNILLKQGAYNYQYIYLPEEGKKGTTAPTDGNFYEAENEYTVKVYHRAPGERYDRLIGFSFVKSVN